MWRLSPGLLAQLLAWRNWPFLNAIYTTLRLSDALAHTRRIQESLQDTTLTHFLPMQHLRPETGISALSRPATLAASSRRSPNAETNGGANLESIKWIQPLLIGRVGGILFFGVYAVTGVRQKLEEQRTH